MPCTIAHWVKLAKVLTIDVVSKLVNDVYEVEHWCRLCMEIITLLAQRPRKQITLFNLADLADSHYIKHKYDNRLNSLINFELKDDLLDPITITDVRKRLNLNHKGLKH